MIPTSQVFGLVTPGVGTPSGLTAFALVPAQRARAAPALISRFLTSRSPSAISPAAATIALSSRSTSRQTPSSQPTTILAC